MVRRFASQPEDFRLETTQTREVEKKGSDSHSTKTTTSRSVAVATEDVVAVGGVVVALITIVAIALHAIPLNAASGGLAGVSTVAAAIGGMYRARKGKDK